MPARDLRFWTSLPVPGNPKVSVAVAAFQQPDELACLLYSFKAQTYPNWEALIVHDGPGPDVRVLIEQIGDPRIRLDETPRRQGQFGHAWRQRGIDLCQGDFIGLTNDDNYYAPVYFEWMLHALVTNDADFAYCNMIHSHQGWSYFPTKPRTSALDLGAWLARAALVKATPWRDFGFAGDGTFIEDLVAKAGKVVQVPGCLFVHN